MLKTSQHIRQLIKVGQLAKHDPRQYSFFFFCCHGYSSVAFSGFHVPSSQILHSTARLSSRIREPGVQRGVSERDWNEICFVRSHPASSSWLPTIFGT